MKMQEPGDGASTLHETVTCTHPFLHSERDPRSHGVMLRIQHTCGTQNLPHIQTFAFLKAKRILQLQI